LDRIRDLSDAVRRVAEDEAISRALEEGDSDKLQAICEAAYERYEDPSAGLKSGDNSPFYVWFVADKNGLSRANSRNGARNFLGGRFNLRDYFKGARALSQRGSRETYISNAFKGIPGGLYEFAISTPIYRSGGSREWIGVLGAAVATTAKLGSLVLDDDRNRVALAAPWDPHSPPNVCYPGSTMSKVSHSAKPRAPQSRPGRTEKISVSLDRSDVHALRRRAKKLYNGNLSAAVAEGARRIREEEGREALVAWLGQAAEATPEERDALRAEWRPEPPKRRRTRAA
jgi:hypothetical protein